MTATAETTPRPVLGLRDAIGLIVGTIVGVGIFRTPSLVAEHAGSASVALIAWVAGGLVSLLGALCYAELASTYPNTGGDYHYLTRLPSAPTLVASARALVDRPPCHSSSTCSGRSAARTRIS